MSGFLTELSPRNVFRVAGLYTVTAWLVLQVVDVLNEALKMPDWVDGFFAIALIAGFPVAVVLAWAFEMTPEGIRVTAPSADGADHSPRAAGGTLDFVIAAGVLCIGGFVAWQTVTDQVRRGDRALLRADE